MSNSSKIALNQITAEDVLEILASVIPVLKAAKVEYFIAGAFARDIGLYAKGFTEQPARKTEDVDLAVMVGSAEEYEALKAKIASLPNFVPDGKEPYRFIYKNACEVDFLPFGEIANEKGQVVLKAKGTFILDMPGFDKVQPWIETVETEEGIELKVSSLPGVVLLKLLAW
ncbi:MAG: hypothetical protein ACE5FF_09760, partial [Saprospiraceae bacterium]